MAVVVMAVSALARPYPPRRIAQTEEKAGPDGRDRL